MTDRSMPNALIRTALAAYCAALLFFWGLNLGCDTLDLWLSLPLRLVLGVPAAILCVLITYLHRRVHQLELQAANLSQRLDRLEKAAAETGRDPHGTCTTIKKE